MNEKENVNNHVEDKTQTIQLKPSPKIDSKEQKPKVKFSQVDVYFFERCQGFQSIPGSDNESNSITLGMSYFHNDFNKFITQEEFLKFKRKLDLNKIDNFINSIDPNDVPALNEAVIERAKEVLGKREYYEENIDQDLEISADILCPILTTEQRIGKLVNTGYHREEIDSKESEDINLIRESRLICGCVCSKMNMVCGENGDMCSCFANGINCQIDRMKFPCSCNLKRCKNTFGMKRFNPKTVYDHYKKVLSGNKANEKKPKPKGKKRKNTQTKTPAKRNKISHEETDTDIVDQKLS